MRVFLVSLCAAAFAASTLRPAPARAQDSLTGEMSAFNYLLGEPWGCATSVPAFGDQPARNDVLTVAFDVAPRNVLHDHVSGGSYMGDDYFGYSADMSNYWSTSASNGATHGFMTSADGKTYTGTNWIGSITMSVTNTFTKVSDKAVRMRQVISENGKQFTIEGTCTR